MCRLVSNYQQVRFKRQTKAQYRVQPDWFTVKNSRHGDEGLTVHNEKFVKEFIHDTYRDQGSRLKDNPWPRHEYKRGYVLPVFLLDLT